MEPGEAVRLLVDSLRIYSPTGGESEMASFLVESMGRLGYSRVRTDGAGNALGEIGSGKVRLLLCGHMDTVPGNLPVRVTDDAVSGRGAADAKSPLCSLLLAGAAAADSGCRITFAGVTDEEGEGAGVEQLMKGVPAFDYAVFGEPSGADRVTVGYRGRMSLKLTVRTAGGHAGSPWAHRSAFDGFASVLAELRSYESAKRVEGDNFRSLSLTPTLVTAGSYQNVVPALCEATLDLRLPPSIASSQAVKDIRSIIGSSDFGADVKLVPGPPTEAIEVPPGSRLARAFQRAIILRLKAKPALVRKTGTGDMNTYAQRTGTRCLTYGPGVSSTSHTESETVGIKDYLDSVDVTREAVGQLASMEPD